MAIQLDSLADKRIHPRCLGKPPMPAHIGPTKVVSDNHQDVGPRFGIGSDCSNKEKKRS